MHRALSYSRPLQDDFGTLNLPNTAPILFLKEVERVNLSFTLYLKIKVLNYFNVEKLNAIIHHFGDPVGYVNLVDVLRP